MSSTLKAKYFTLRPRPRPTFIKFIDNTKINIGFITINIE